MYKTDIREQMKEKRGQLTQSEIVQKSQIICDEIIKRFPDRDMTVCLYFPIRNEVDIRPLFSFYRNIYLPVTIGDEISFFKFQERLVPGRFGVMEPEQTELLNVEPDLVIVPGVAFDVNGNRVGYGKGYYDRFLSDKSCETVGVAYDFQIVDEIYDVNETDVKLTAVVSDGRVVWNNMNKTINHEQTVAQDDISEVEEKYISKKMKKKKKKKRIIFSVIAVIIFLVIGSGLADFYGIGNKKNVEIVIPEGAGVQEIASILKEKGCIEYEILFSAYAVLNNQTFHAGSFVIDESGYRNIANIISKKTDVKTINITFPEGLELHEIKKQFVEAGLCTEQEFDTYANVAYYDYDFLKDLPERGNMLEGYLFPDTYNFSYDEGIQSMLNKMLSNFDIKVYQPLKAEVQKQGKSFDDVIIMASIIEREGATENEFQRISGVFYNRLNRKGESIGKLESCATVQYILKERKNVLSVSDTKIDSPYNTYMYEGLPKGPIAAPGYAAVYSAVYPEESDYLYFCADGSGTHYFAATLAEHEENKRKAGL